MKAAIYIRVSTSDQGYDKEARKKALEEGMTEEKAKAKARKASLDQQQERCEAYAKAQDWEVAQVYEGDGESGAKRDRPALNRLMADAHSGKFQVVVFLKLDRFGRDTRDLLNISHELKERGVGMASVQDGFDTNTPSGQLYYTILGAMAEFERQKILERMKDGKLGSAKKGQFSCTRTAYGYDYDTETKKLVINNRAWPDRGHPKTEAEAVRYIYDLYIKGGLSHRALAKRLNNEGVPTKTSEVHPKSIDGKHQGWFDGTVERILSNPMYKGEAYFNKTEQKTRKARPKSEWIPIDCPAIVSDKTWAAARRRAKKNLKNSRRPKDGLNDFLLSQLLKCHCGRKMYGVTSRERYRYFYCTGQRRYNTPCHPKAINATAVEQAVLDHIIEIFRDPQRVLAACDDYAEQQRAAEGWSESEMERLRAELAAAGEKRQRAIALYTEGTISKADLNTDFARIDKDNEMRQDELQRMEAAARQRKTAEEAEQAAWAMAGRMKDVVGELTLAEKKELVRTGVEMVTVDAEGGLDIECALPTDRITVPSGDRLPSG